MDRQFDMKERFDGVEKKIYEMENQLSRQMYQLTAEVQIQTLRITTWIVGVWVALSFLILITLV